MKPAEDLKSSLRWPFAAGSVLGNVSGALRDSDGAIKRLYFFTAIDPSALAVDFDEGPGWWPRAGHRIVKTEAEPERAVEQAPDKPALPAHVRPQAAAVLLVVSLVLFAMAASGVFGLAHPPETGKWYDWCGWMKPGKDNDNLVPAFLLVMASLTALVLGAGLGLKGRWFGALIDERNRVSLTRLQQLAWGILLFSALAVTAWFNAGIINWLATPASGNANNELFPQVDAALWAAAGITLAVTPFLSGQILAVKQQGADSAQDAGPTAPARAAPAGMITPADLDRNETPADAGWVDLITGETTGKDETIDVSRLQQLIISGLLLGGYLIALVDQLSGIAAKTVIAALPHVDTQGTFIELLAFSNGTYLGFKARAQSQSQPAPAKN